MEKLSKQDLYSLEQYAEARADFREKVLIHKQPRQVRIGEHLTLYFEDRMTMQYQIQEMLRIEKIFEAADIQEELDVYNALIPDGDNLKATMMIEYADVEERKVALHQLVGIEDQTWVQVEGHEKVYAIANEDLERSDADKTSAVHFVRFQLTETMVSDFRQGGSLSAGCDHDHYQMALNNINQSTLDTLRADLD